MGKVPLKKPAINIAPQSTETEAKPGLFKNINPTGLKRETEMRTTLLMISEIEEFEDNPRKIYEEEDQELLQKSIKKSGITEEIGVFHIKEGDRYIICDGHRRKRAIQGLYGDSYKVEVMVRKEFDSYDTQVKTELLRTGLATSSLKKTLSLWEELEAIEKYCDNLDKINPETAPHKITQESVYGGIYKHGKAMQLGKILESTDKEQRELLKDNENVTLKLMREVAYIVDKVDDGTKTQIFDLIHKKKIESSSDLKEVIEARKEVNDIIPDDIDEREEKITKMTEKKLDDKKRIDSEIDTGKNPQLQYLRDLRKFCKGISKAGLMLDVDSISLDIKGEVFMELKQAENVIVELLSKLGDEGQVD